MSELPPEVVNHSEELKKLPVSYAGALDALATQHKAELIEVETDLAKAQKEVATLKSSVKEMTDEMLELQDDLDAKSKAVANLQALSKRQRQPDAGPPELIAWFEHGRLEEAEQEYLNTCMLASRQHINRAYCITSPWRYRNLVRWTQHANGSGPYHITFGYKATNALPYRENVADPDGWASLYDYVGRLFDIVGPQPEFVLEMETALSAFWGSSEDDPRYPRAEMAERFAELQRRFPETSFIVYPGTCTISPRANLIEHIHRVENNLWLVLAIQQAAPKTRFTVSQYGSNPRHLEHSRWTLISDAVTKVLANKPVGCLYYKPCYSWLWDQDDPEALKYATMDETYVWAGWTYNGSLLSNLTALLSKWDGNNTIKVTRYNLNKAQAKELSVGGARIPAPEEIESPHTSEDTK